MVSTNNKFVHPQEIEVWYVLPAIRRELTLELKKRGIEQKKIALLLGVSEPAISQYFSKKRASGLKFNDTIKKEIKKSVDKILKNNKKFLSEMHRIMLLHQMKEITCMIHRKHGEISKNCRICFESAL